MARVALGATGKTAVAERLLHLFGALAVQENPEAAQEHLHQAWGWARASSEVEARLRCHELAARVALQRAATDEALLEAEAGLSLATTYGFGLFRSRLASLVARATRVREPRGAMAMGLAALEATQQEDAWGWTEALQIAAEAPESSGQDARARELRQEASVLEARLHRLQ